MLQRVVGVGDLRMRIMIWTERAHAGQVVLQTARSQKTHHYFAAKQVPDITPVGLGVPATLHTVRRLADLSQLMPFQKKSANCEV